jgi:mRNA interferase MazF
VSDPARAEVWQVDFGTPRGHEQGGIRPALVLSVDSFNSSAADLVIVLPLTTKRKGVLWHVEVQPPEGGLRAVSYIKCEDIRSVSKDRFLQRWGAVSGQTMTAVEDHLRILLGLSALDALVGTGKPV